MPAQTMISQGGVDAPTKPRFGEPCNGCGVCCAMEVCRVGLIAFGSSATPCPALIFDDDRFWCGMVVLEKAKADRPLLANTLAIGRGCDSQMDGETRESESPAQPRGREWRRA